MLNPMSGGDCGDSSAARSVRDVWLETPRLILREHTENDFESVLAYASDPEVQRYALTPQPSRAEVAANLACIARQRAEEPARLLYHLAVVQREDNELVGWIPLILSEEAGGDAEIGWTFARAQWGRGYATEAAAAALTFAFETLGWHRIRAHARLENVASLRVMEKLGMRHEARATEDICVAAGGDQAGMVEGVVEYAIVKGEWLARERTQTE